MDRRGLLLAVLASSGGRTFTPVQLQKAVFLVTKNAPFLVDSGPSFQFVPYDYGPFDANVYSEADLLHLTGDAVIAPSPGGRWNTYAASDQGVASGSRLLSQMEPNVAAYIRRTSEWVRGQSFRSLVKSIYDAYPEMKVNSVFRG